MQIYELFFISMQNLRKNLKIVICKYRRTHSDVGLE